MLKRTRRESQDINQFVADVVRRSTGTEPPAPSEATISEVMRAMGRRGGLKDAATLNASATEEIGPASCPGSMGEKN